MNTDNNKSSSINLPVVTETLSIKKYIIPVDDIPYDNDDDSDYDSNDDSDYECD